MFRTVLPFPVLPGHSDAEVKSMGEDFADHPDEYWRSRNNAGISLERAYLMKTPMGSFVIAYAESEKDSTQTIGTYMTSDLEIDKRFMDFVARVHGFTPEAAAAMPPPETVGEWFDPDVTTRRKGLGFVAPLIPDQVEYGRAFAKEAWVTRKDEFTASRRALKQNVEVVTLVQSPMGPIIAVYIEGEDPVRGNAEFAASQSPFDRWFKDELRKIIPPPVNFDEPLPPIEAFFDSQKVGARV